VGVGTFINLLSGNSIRPYSAPTLNDNGYAAVIVAPGLSTAAGGTVGQWVLDLVSFRACTSERAPAVLSFYPQDALDDLLEKYAAR
jgi:hypothetical protein